MGFAGGVDSVAGDTVADSKSNSGYAKVTESGGRDYNLSRADVDRDSSNRAANRSNMKDYSATFDAIDKAAAVRKSQQAVDFENQAISQALAREAAAREAAAERAASNSFSNTDIIAAAKQNVGIPSIMTGSGAMSPPVSPVTPTTNPLTATAGRYGTMGFRAPAITDVSAKDRERMIRTVLGESGGESLIGQTGVASVIANRLRAGNYGSTIGDVVNASGQFSTWNPGDPAGDMANRVDPNSQAYKNAADIVDSVLRGEARDPTGGALNFSNVNTVMTSGKASDATKARVATESALPSATIIGRHTFTSPTGDRPTQVASIGGTIASAGKYVVDAIINAPGDTIKFLTEAFDSTPQIKALEDQNRLAGGLTKEEYAKEFKVDPSKVQSRIVDYGQGQQVDYYTKSLGDVFGEAASDFGKGISNAGKGITSLFGGETSTAPTAEVYDKYGAAGDGSPTTGFGPGGDLTRDQYRDQYGGRDIATNMPPTGASLTPNTLTTPTTPTEPTAPIMPTVPNFAAAQQYIGTPTVATPGFNFLMPFAPRPQVDFANLGQAYAPTALPSAPPSQPLPGIPGAAYATPYQRLG